MVTIKDLMSFLITLRDQREHILGDLRAASSHISKYPEAGYSITADITSTINDVCTILGFMYADLYEEIEKSEVKNEQN